MKDKTTPRTDAFDQLQSVQRAANARHTQQTEETTHTTGHQIKWGLIIGGAFIGVGSACRPMLDYAYDVLVYVL